jgi:anti-sigma regulatory factor (Ser/Thr protein kinase)
MSTRLCFPAERGSLAEARAALRLALRRERWDDEGTELVVLAVCETLTNAIEHGSVPDDPIEIQIAATAAHAEIRVTDRGRAGAGPPAGIPPPPPPSAEHGRGLIIMSELADVLEIRRAGRGTEVRLQFTAPVTLQAWNEPPSREPVLA